MVKNSIDQATVENEAIFRRANEEVQKGFKQLKRMAEADGHGSFHVTGDIPLHFYCECSDENCRDRIVIDTADYEKIHKNRRHFILTPGHEVLAIEKIIRRTDTYNIVEKFVIPDENVMSLKRTDVNNV